MKDDFFDFLNEPTKEAFLKARAQIVAHEDYNPYSDDPTIIQDLLMQKEYEKVMNYTNINTILSPRVHLMKKYAATQLGREKDATSEDFLGYRILEGILATGDGSKEHPYMVLRVSDERDFLSFIGEEFASQALIKEEKTYDCIHTQSGKSIYFDITDCYRKIASYSFEDMLNSLDIEEETPEKKVNMKVTINTQRLLILRRNGGSFGNFHLKN
ncbi:DUF4919 domain-containing protein [Kordia jejudonensis]|uniref:DUF4919 domain-containing protein n=1 Tax=Kordia jejudonensis TaxID=1348245 RepID=UPI000629102B|nr:DUF4919 domain-containing protein [Kordia jejudonensis]